MMLHAATCVKLSNAALTCARASCLVVYLQQALQPPSSCANAPLPHPYTGHPRATSQHLHESIVKALLVHNLG